MAERTLQAKLKVRSDTATNWQSNNPVLLQGEPALETDTNKLKFGNGTSAYNDLPYISSDAITVEANPTEEATQTLQKLRVGNSVYSIPQGAEVIDLGTVTLTEADGVYGGTVTVTSEQVTKMKADPPPIVKFEWNGGGTYSLSRLTVVPDGSGKDGIIFSGTVVMGYQFQAVMLAVSEGSTITANIGITTILLPNEESGVEVVDLGTVQLSDGTGTSTITIEQFTKLANSPYPQLKMSLAGLGGSSLATVSLSFFMHDTNEDTIVYSGMAFSNSTSLMSILFYAKGSYSSGSMNANVYVQNNDLSNDLPSGGKTGQVLKKKSNSEYDVEWGDVEAGTDGTTFTPAVDAEGNLSWTNDGGLPNPETVNIRGADGQAATIQIGEVTTGAAGSQASVTNSGTANAAVLDMTIPRGADGASGVTDVTAGTPTEQDGYTVTPVTFNFEQGNSKTVNIQAKNGDGAGVQQNAVINRTASVDTADENSPDFVIKEGNLYVKAEGKLGTYAFTYINNGGTVQDGVQKGAAATTSAVYIFGNLWSANRSNYIYKYDPEANSVSRLSTTIPTTLADMGIASIGDVIYLFGGSTGTGSENSAAATNTIYKFDAQTETITALTATLPTSCWGCSAAYSPSNNKIYVFGGNTPIDPLNTILEFDPTTETISSVSTFPLSYSNGRGIFHAPAVTIGTKIYLFAGQGDGYYRYSDVWIFDTVSKTIIQRISGILPAVFEYYFGAATLNNGLVYLFDKEEDADTPVYVFNPSTQQVYSTTSLCPLQNPTACAYKESIIVVGNKDYAPSSPIRIFAEEEGLRYFRIPVQDSLGVISAGGFNATT